MATNIRIVRREYLRGRYTYDIYVYDLPRAWDIAPGMLGEVLRLLITHVVG